MEGSLNHLRKFLTQIYEDTICRIYGDRLHPDGLNLTQRIGELANITRESTVLDVASGTGATALSIAKNFECSVVGIDLSKKLVKKSKSKISWSFIYEKLEFLTGDAETLPFKDSSFNVVLCECAFNLFPDKKRVLGEIYRVLKSGGKFLLADFVLKRELSEHQRNEFSFAFCIAGAERSEKLLRWIKEANFTDTYIEDHSDKLLPFGIQLMLTSSSFVSENLEALENLLYEDYLSYLLITASKPP